MFKGENKVEQYKGAEWVVSLDDPEIQRVRVFSNQQDGKKHQKSFIPA